MVPVNRRQPTYFVGRLGLFLILFLVIGCSGPQRNALPEALVDSARIAGVPYSYLWGDEPPPNWLRVSEESRQGVQRLVAEQGADILTRPLHYLAVSGGGASGAYGAGLLKGWTSAGTRPEFTIVTGISTGAIIATFAFLGPGYDHVLERIYTRYQTDDALRFRSWFRALLGESAAEASGMRTLIERYVNDAVITAIADEHRKGRVLWIGTTNLDAGRPVIWNIGEIAAIGSPAAHELVRDVILASTSIPGVFPPVMIDYEAEGRQYDQMHADGGVSRQVFLFPAAMQWNKLITELGFSGEQNLYVIRNSNLINDPQVVARKLANVAMRSIGILTTNQGIGDLYQLYLIATNNDIGYNLAVIPPDFEEKPMELFGPVYMQKLYQLGVQVGSTADHWQHYPPGFSEFPITNRSTENCLDGCGLFRYSGPFL